jgi:predicted AAA+ superfamily ATPase
LLARELATSLRGRTISYEVFPLSFAEFLRFRDLQLKPYSAISDIRVSAALNGYLTIGGLPEVVLAQPELPASLLNAHKVYKDFRSQGYELSKDTLSARRCREHLTHESF